MVEERGEERRDGLERWRFLELLLLRRALQQGGNRRVVTNGSLKCSCVVEERVEAMLWALEQRKEEGSRNVIA